MRFKAAGIAVTCRIDHSNRRRSARRAVPARRVSTGSVKTKKYKLFTSKTFTNALGILTPENAAAPTRRHVVPDGRYIPELKVAKDLRSKMLRRLPG